MLKAVASQASSIEATSFLVYNVLQIFWHIDQWWISDAHAHLTAGMLEQHAIE